MVHQPRRSGARVAAALLGLVVLVGVMIGRVASPVDPSPAARADVSFATDDLHQLDVRTAPVMVALNEDRSRAGLGVVHLDSDLAATAASDACAIAHGDVPVVGDLDRARLAGAERQNTGVVLDDDPAAGAQMMADWWAHTRRHRAARMDPEMTRYGIGACTVANRTYYVERFAR